MISVGPRDISGQPLLRVVCRRCGMVMDDCEPMGTAEFHHKTKHKDGSRSRCKNAGKTFGEHATEVGPFMRKRTRRAARRAGLR